MELSIPNEIREIRPNDFIECLHIPINILWPKIELKHCEVEKNSANENECIIIFTILYRRFDN